jgi:hypothetical protein
VKIPQVLADAGIPTSIPAGRASPGAYGAPAEAAARGFAHVATRLEQLSGVIAERDRVLRDQQAKSDAALVESQIEMGLVTADSTLKQSIRDPQDYAKSWQDVSQQVTQDALKNVKYPETAAMVQQRLPAILTRHYAQMVNHRDALVLQKSEANLVTTIETRRQIGSSIPVEDVATAAANLDRTRDAIMTEAQVIGLDKAAVKVKQEEQYQIDERARRDIAQNAQGFLDRVPTDPLYRQLDPKVRDELIKQAKTLTLAQQKDVLARQEKFQTDLHAKLVQEQKYAALDLDRALASGTLTREQLELSAEMRRIDDTAYRRLDEGLRNPKQGPSTPDILTRFSIKAHRSVPQVTEDELAASYQAFQRGQPGLNHQDYVSLADKVVSRNESLRAEARTEDSRTRAIANSEQAQAEQVLFKGLGIPTLYDKLDPLKEKLLDSGLRELTARSRAFKKPDGTGGTEAPIDVTNDILKRFQPLLAREAQMNYRQVEGTLRYKTTQALEAAAAAGLIRGEAYKKEKDKFIELDRLRRENSLAIGEAARKNTPSTPAPTGSEPEREIGMP